MKAYEEAKAKFDADMSAFLEAGGVKSKGVTALRAEKRKAKEGGGDAKRAKKDPNAPKRPAGGAFGCFLAANRKAFEKECPGAVTAVTKLASSKWKEASQAEKDEYEKQYQAKKAAYDEAMKSYVPPVAEADEDDGEDQDEDEDDGGQVDKTPRSAAKGPKKAETKTPKSAAKCGRGRGRGAAKAPEPEVDIPKIVSDKAEKAGMDGVLKKLLGRDDIKAKGVNPNVALAALERSGGLLHPARTALLGA